MTTAQKTSGRPCSLCAAGRWLALFAVAAAAWSGTLGEVVSIRGHVADIALDESRGRLYAANFTANRIEVISTRTRRIESSIPVASQPGSVALSPDYRYLLVTHFGNREGAAFNNNAYTILNLETGTQQNFGSLSTPLAASFAKGGQALVVTSSGFLFLDPLNGTSTVLLTAQSMAETLAVEIGSKPAQITQATMTTSQDGMMIFGLVSLQVNDDTSQGDVSAVFRYDVLRSVFRSIDLQASPPLGPRAVSASRDGAFYMAGWGMFDLRDTLIAQFPNASGRYDIGTHVFDAKRGFVYAQFRALAASSQSGGSTGGTSGGATTPVPAEPPVLLVLDDDNLAIRAKYNLPENLSGKSLLSSDEDTMYAASESGVMILDVGRLNERPRISVNREDVLFETSFASNSIQTQEIEIIDPGGGSTAFVLDVSTPGISVEPIVGHTPAKVRIRMDPVYFQNNRGTVAIPVNIVSGAAINVPDPIRILVNSRGPDQKGKILNVPGKLVDILADPVRDRFYVLRQDRNQVLAFDGTTYSQIATLRTGNTPMSLAITRDNRYLLVGNDNSGLANVFDLQTLMPDRLIAFPIGHYPRSLAASNSAILAASRVAGPKHTIDRVDFVLRRGAPYSSLGVFLNDVSLDTKLSPSPSGETVYAVGAKGELLLYEASADTFVVARKDFESLQNGYAALGDDYFAVGTELLNSSLVHRGTFSVGAMIPAGYAAAAGKALRVLAESAGSPGLIERFEVGATGGSKLVRLAEAPRLANDAEPFTRVLAPLSNQRAIMMLSTSGLVALPWDFDQPIPTPVVNAIVNSANYQPQVASGGLVSIFGTGLSRSSTAAPALPLPTTLADTVVQLNGRLLPLLYVSPGQINAQLPFGTSGRQTLLLTNTGGQSQAIPVDVKAQAPSVFETGSAGPKTQVPTIVRAENNQLVTLANPVHPKDVLVIYATGLGDPAAPVEPGAASPVVETLVPPTVTLGNAELPILYAGLAPGFAGVYQINVSVPWWVSTGMEVPLTIQQGDASTTLKVRVVN